VFLRQIRIWPVELSTAVAYGDLYNELKGKGRVLSQVDMMIAALARRMDLVVLTTDRDFEALPDIVTENWIAESS
jgi:tRNA(fMet)-specific endonuclease VapC